MVRTDLRNEILKDYENGAFSATPTVPQRDSSKPLSLEPEGFDSEAYKKTVAEADTSLEPVPDLNAEQDEQVDSMREAILRKTLLGRFRDDLKDVIVEYGANAVDNWKNLNEAKNAQALNNPLAVTGTTPQGEFFVNPNDRTKMLPSAPKGNPAIEKWASEMLNKFTQETMLPAAMVASIISPTTIGGLVGAGMMGVGVQQNIVKPLKEGKFGEAAKGAGSLAYEGIGLGGLDRTQQELLKPDFSDEFYKNPARKSLAILNELFPTLLGGYHGIKGATSAIKSRIAQLDALEKSITESPAFIESDLQAKIKAQKQTLKEKMTSEERTATNLNIKEMKQQLNELRETEAAKQLAAEEAIAKQKAEGAELLQQRADLSESIIDARTRSKEVQDFNNRWRSPERREALKRRKENFENNQKKTIEGVANNGSMAEQRAMNDNYIILTPGESTLSSFVKRNDIYGMLREIVPTATGFVHGKGVLGIFKPDIDVIRSKKFGDFGVLAHELGHYLNEQFKISGFDDELVGMAEKGWGKNKYKWEEMRGEGIAEFTREYLINPETAKQNFPGFYDAFEAELAKKPALADRVNTIGDNIRKWYTQTDEAKILGSIVYGDDGGKVSWLDSPNAKLKEELYQGYTNFVDKFKPLEVAAERYRNVTGKELNYDQKVHLRALMADGQADAAFNMLVHDTDSVAAVDAINKIHGDILPHHVTFRDVLNVLDTRELNAKYPEYLKSLYGEPDSLLGKVLGRKVATWYDAFNVYITAQRSLEILTVKMAERTAEARALVIEANNAYLKSPSDVTRKALEKAQKKLTRIEANPYETVLSDTNNINTAKAFKDIIKRAPEEFKKASELYDKFNDNVLEFAKWGGFVDDTTYKYIKENYKHYAPLYREMPDEFKAFRYSTGGSQDGLANLRGYIDRLSETGSNTNVLDPLGTELNRARTMFRRAERNRAMMDFFDLVEKEKAPIGIEPIKSPDGTAWDKHSVKNKTVTLWKEGKEVAYAIHDDDLYVCLSNFGNKSWSNSVMRGLQAATRAVRQFYTMPLDFVIANFIRDTTMFGVLTDTGGVPLYDTMKGLKALMFDKERTYEFKAAGVRMDTRTNYERYDFGGLKDRYSNNLFTKAKVKVGEAYGKYKDLTGLLEESNRMAEFMRAREQGKSISEAGLMAKDITVNFGRSGKYGQYINQVIPFWNASVQGLDKYRRAFIANPERTAIKTAIVSGISLMLWLKNNTDERYQNLPQDVKDRNYVVGFAEDGSAVTLPKTQEVGYIFGTGLEYVLEHIKGENTRHGFGDFGRFVVRETLPPFTDVVFNMYAQLRSDKNFFTDSSIDSPRLQKVPKAERSTIYTTGVSKNITNFIKYVSGAEVSPQKSDFIMRELTGKVATSTIIAGEEASDFLFGEKLKVPARYASEILSMTRFIRPADKRTAAEEDYYNVVYDIEDSTNSIDKARAEDAKLKWKQTKSLREDIMKLQKRYNEVLNSDMGRAEKREVCNGLHAQKVEKMKQANKIFYGD